MADISDAPFGAPEASPIKVYRVAPETGERVLVREEDPWDSDLAPGTTLAGGPGQAWVRPGMDGRAFADEVTR